MGLDPEGGVNLTTAAVGAAIPAVDAWARNMAASGLANFINDNTKLLKERYEATGGAFTVKIVPGEGHKVGPSFFECQELVQFVLKHAK